MAVVPSFVIAGLAVVVLVAVQQQAAGFGTIGSSGIGRGKAGAATTSRLFAEAPKYQKQKGFLQGSEPLGRGNYLLTIDYDRGDDDIESESESESETSFPRYEPGHVLALEIQPPESPESDVDASAGVDASATDRSNRMTTVTEKTKKDLGANGGWLRGPYTVSYGYGSERESERERERNDGFKVLVKEVGYKSHVLATSAKGTPVLFGGKFKVPIAEGILASASGVSSHDAEASEARGETEKVVLVSTGVGVGPCVGAAEELSSLSLSSSSGGHAIRSIDLLASFRTEDEIYRDPVLETLAGGNGVVRYTPIVTDDGGRLAARGTEWLAALLGAPGSRGSAVAGTHYHIIGNGQLVNEWKEGLAGAGVPPERITVEAYFNHSAPPDPSAVETIRGAVVEAAAATATAAAAASVVETEEAAEAASAA